MAFAQSALPVLAGLHGGLVVSCQARAGNPFHGPASMVMMARAAELGGARGLRVDGPAEVAAVLAATGLPVMATFREEHDDSAVRITPTARSATALVEAGARIVALDATDRPRPGGERLRDVVRIIHGAGGVAMGDLATVDDLRGAIAAGIDAIGTTLAGYTGLGPPPDEPDFALLEQLVKASPVPVFAAGRFWSPGQVVRAFEVGASFVVVGTAITNPMAITSRFVNALSDRRRD